MAWTESLPGGGYRGRYYDQNGQKQTADSPDGQGFRYEQDAKYAAEEQAAKARRKTAPTSADATLPASMLWSDWWDRLALKREFPHTDTARTEGIVVENHVRPKWGTTPLNEITKAAAQDWVDIELRTRPRMSHNYATKIYGTFVTSIRAAVAAEILDGYPLVGVKLPKPQKRPKPYLSVAHAPRLMAELRPDYADAVEFGLETGVRPGELCGLHADRVDFDRGWMLVAEVLLDRKCMIRPFPKDGDARMVPLTDRAMEILKRRLGKRNQYAGCGVPHTDGARCGGVLVFLTDYRRPMRPESFRYAMKGASERAEVPRRSPYALRRGFGTRAADGGLDAFQLSDIFGHASLDESMGYVQQSSSARMKLTEALARYPVLLPSKPA